MIEIGQGAWNLKLKILIWSILRLKAMSLVSEVIVMLIMKLECTSYPKKNLFLHLKDQFTSLMEKIGTFTTGLV